MDDLKSQLTNLKTDDPGLTGDDTDEAPIEETPVKEAALEQKKEDQTERAEDSKDSQLSKEGDILSTENITGSEQSEESELENSENQVEQSEPKVEAEAAESSEETEADEMVQEDSNPNARWYVVHTYSGHENKVAATLKQRIESEHLENQILDVLVPTQDKIEIRAGKKETVKEKIFPGYILVKMVLDDNTWLAVRTTQGVTSFVGMGNKPTPIPNSEVATIVKYMKQGGQPSYKQIFTDGDTVKIVDGPFSEFIGKIDNVDKERGKVKVLVSIFGRETPVELDFLQIQKL